LKNNHSFKIQYAQLSVKALLQPELRNGSDATKHRHDFVPAHISKYAVFASGPLLCPLVLLTCKPGFALSFSDVRALCSLLRFFSFPVELFFLKFIARSGLCSLIYQILPRAKQLDLSVTISRYIGLAPFSSRSMTLKWFRVPFFRSFFPVDSFGVFPFWNLLYLGFPFQIQFL